MTSVQRLDAVAHITMGQAPVGESYNDREIGIPLIAGAGDFGTDRPVVKKFTTAPSKICDAGDIVLGIRASIGARVIADRSYCLGRGVAGIRPKADLDARFLWHWLSISAPALLAKAKGATFLQVNRDDIGSLEIDVPSLAEQRRIATILDKADELRAKRRVARAQLDTLIQSIFLDMFGDPSVNPKGFTSVRLGDHAAKIGSGATPTGGEEAYKRSGVALIRSMNVRDGAFAHEGLVFIDESQAARLDGVIVAPGDVLLNITGASVARVCRAPEDVQPARVNQHVAIIRPSAAIDPVFLEHFLLMPPIKHRLLQIARAGATREAITKHQIENLHVLQPPLLLQTRFSAAMKRTDQMKRDINVSLLASQALIMALRHRAFRGEL